MSDSEAAPHPSYGGKSLEPFQPAISDQPQERRPYKSWRKKYRKMRARFDGVLEENKILFKQEHKLEGIAKRLREELEYAPSYYSPTREANAHDSGLLEICLDINSNPSIPPDLRFNVQRPNRPPPPIHVDPNITPEAANAMLTDYKLAVTSGSIPPLDLHVVRDAVEQRLAAQEVEALAALEASIPHPVQHPTAQRTLPEDVAAEDAPAYLTPEQEDLYLARLDAKLGDPYPLLAHKPSLTASSTAAAIVDEEKHTAEMTPRELERHIELLNPQSQHSWLKHNHKPNAAPGALGEGDDVESLASYEPGHAPASKPRKPRGPRGTGKNLAKQVGDRAVERAREGFSPSAVSADEDGMMMDEGAGGSARRKGRDPDGAYRIKGGRSGGGGKSKRKRSAGDEVGGVVGGVGSKKPRVEVTGREISREEQLSNPALDWTLLKNPTYER